MLLFLLTLFIYQANAFNLIEPTELTVSYKNYSIVNAHSRNALIYPELPKENVSLAANFSVFDVFYLDSLISGITTNTQYRAISLDLRTGVHLTHQIDLGFYHQSQHILDGVHSYIPGYPEEDAFEIRFNILKSNTIESIF